MSQPPSDSDAPSSQAPTNPSSQTGPSLQAVRSLRTTSGAEYPLPLFMPVYQRNSALIPVHGEKSDCEIDACMVNAYFLYKNREMRRRFREGLTLREYIEFPRLLMTDSGAFQGFARTLLLSNTTIIKFQELIQTDIASPLDLVTPPGDSRSVAEQKMEATLKRVAEGQRHVAHSLLTGVQQGGRFPELRHRCVERLMELNCKYLALGSLVPFFTRNHDLGFVGRVIRDARQVAGPDVPIHVYGAGDPVELPLMAAMGADVFDSSSYVHFARHGSYMTPYGALPDPSRLLAGEYPCDCPTCQRAEGPREVFADVSLLAAHNLWTICDTVEQLRKRVRSGDLDAWISTILEVHTTWFPDSLLARSWSALHE